MEREIDLAGLKGVAILYENDLHDLGKFVLRAFGAMGGNRIEGSSDALRARQDL